MIDDAVLAELRAQLEAAIEELRAEQARAVDAATLFELTLEGKHPIRAVHGLGAAWNFTAGPAYVWKGPGSIDEINALGEPVVVFADYLDLDTLRKIIVTRVRGYVLGKGSVIDPSYWWLVDENRAAVTCAPEAVASVRPGETVIVDGVRGVVYLDPDPQTLANYERLRQIGPPRRDPLFWEALRRMAGAIMGNHRLRKQEPPFDFPEQDRLIAIAKRARAGEPISPEDDQWMQEQLRPGMPSVEEIQMRTLGKTYDTSGKLTSSGKRASERGRDREGRGARGRGGDSKEANRGRSQPKDDKERSGAARGSAAERRAARQREIEAERARRKGESPPEPDDTPPEPDDDFDPLAGMMG